MMRCKKSLQFLILCCHVCFNLSLAWSSSPRKHSILTRKYSSPSFSSQNAVRLIGAGSRYRHVLGTKGDDSDDTIFPSAKDQLALGLFGTTMSLVVFLSEYVLKTTGCGLPAGPYGVIGAIEGISYLGVASLVALSLYCKVTAGTGLPSGPKGTLGLAEGLSYLAVIIGIVVLVYQVIDFGYIPNAVPMEGGMCR